MRKTAQVRQHLHITRTSSLFSRAEREGQMMSIKERKPLLHSFALFFPVLPSSFPLPFPTDHASAAPPTPLTRRWLFTILEPIRGGEQKGVPHAERPQASKMPPEHHPSPSIAAWLQSGVRRAAVRRCGQEHACRVAIKRAGDPISSLPATSSLALLASRGQNALPSPSAGSAAGAGAVLPRAAVRRAR